jgi:hypothetical protein
MPEWLYLLTAFYVGGGLATAILCYTSYTYTGDLDDKSTAFMLFFFFMSFVFWWFTMCEFIYNSKDRYDHTKDRH